MAFPASVRDLEMPEIIQNYCQTRATARLTVSFQEAEGVFLFADGALVEAYLGDLRGAEAVQSALAIGEGEVRIDLDVPFPASVLAGICKGIIAKNETINSPLLQSVMSAAMSQSSHTTNIVQDKHMESVTSVSISGNSQTRRAKAESEKSAHSMTARLTASGIIREGIIVDGYGVTLCEIGSSANHDDISRRAFLLAGLQSLIADEFDLGEGEGILLEQAEETRVMVREGNISCVFTPSEKLPLTQALTEMRRLLTDYTETVEGGEQ
jgi:hypothetical protein